MPLRRSDFGDNDDLEDIRSGAGQGAEFDPSVVFYPEQYCPIVEAMPTSCFATSILELFAVDGEFSAESERMIDTLTSEQLLQLINEKTKRCVTRRTSDKLPLRWSLLFHFSGLFLQERNFTTFLGDVRRDESGRIVGAKATYMRWFGRANTTEILMAKKAAKGKEDLGIEQQPVMTECVQVVLLC